MGRGGGFPDWENASHFSRFSSPIGDPGNMGKIPSIVRPENLEENIYVDRSDARIFLKLRPQNSLLKLLNVYSGLHILRSGATPSRPASV